MIPLQLGLSFAVWIVAAVFAASRLRPAPHGNPRGVAMGALLFVLSAVVLVGGLAWIARDAPPMKGTIPGSTWLSCTALGALFTIGQAAAASSVLAGSRAGRKVTGDTPDPSSISNHTVRD